jgi:chorismate mutase
MMTLTDSATVAFAAAREKFAADRKVGEFFSDTAAIVMALPFDEERATLAAAYNAEAQKFSGNSKFLACSEKYHFPLHLQGKLAPIIGTTPEAVTAAEEKRARIWPRLTEIVRREKTRYGKTKPILDARQQAEALDRAARYNNAAYWNHLDDSTEERIFRSLLAGEVPPSGAILPRDWYFPARVAARDAATAQAAREAMLLDLPELSGRGKKRKAMAAEIRAQFIARGRYMPDRVESIVKRNRRSSFWIKHAQDDFAQLLYDVEIYGNGVDFDIHLDGGTALDRFRKGGSR